MPSRRKTDRLREFNCRKSENTGTPECKFLPRPCCHLPPYFAVFINGVRHLHPTDTPVEYQPRLPAQEQFRETAFVKYIDLWNKEHDCTEYYKSNAFSSQAIAAAEAALSTSTYCEIFSQGPQAIQSPISNVLQSDLDEYEDYLNYEHEPVIQRGSRADLLKLLSSNCNYSDPAFFDDDEYHDEYYHEEDDECDAYAEEEFIPVPQASALQCGSTPIADHSVISDQPLPQNATLSYVAPPDMQVHPVTPTIARGCDIDPIRMRVAVKVIQLRLVILLVLAWYPYSFHGNAKWQYHRWKSYGAEIT